MMIGTSYFDDLVKKKNCHVLNWVITDAKKIGPQLLWQENYNSKEGTYKTVSTTTCTWRLTATKQDNNNIKARGNTFKKKKNP